MNRVLPTDCVLSLNCALLLMRLSSSPPLEGVTGRGWGRSVWPCALLGREECVAVCCSMLQCVSSVLKCVAVCCSVLRCVVACCSGIIA